jgi:hypothetical protein
VLFLGGIFGGRYLGAVLDETATQKGVRVLCLDRPGMGGSTPVEIEEKMDTTLGSSPPSYTSIDIKQSIPS